jgi:hypothetical protein
VGEPVKGPQRRAAEVLREYATMIEESEIHRSGPMKGKCPPAVQEEIDEYRGLATALEADGWMPIAEKMPDDDITVMVACKDADEPVWLGYHDADGWFSATDGVELTKIVTHWKHVSEAPRAD